ncbi:HU family DNA-binding protein [Actinomadura formosensis]|uniref:HU family DNA-binding protein n=1 Tax=Actinomadura formosensis TaxID=60706 RepID=UPI003D8CCDD2
MNRSELVRVVAERAGSDETAARRHVDAVFDTVMERVSAGERVIVTGFGTFDRLARPARSARNPRTGLPVEVPAAQVPRFRSGQTFRNRVAASDSAPASAPAVEPAAPAVEAAAEPAPAVTLPVEPPAPKKPKGGKGGKKAKKPSGKAKAVASPPAKDTKSAKDTKRPKGGKKKAEKAKARVKAGK